MPVVFPAALDLKCRIVIDHGVENRGLGFPCAHIELTNCSAGVLELDCQSHPLEHLNLVVTNAEGEVVSHAKYGYMLIRFRLERLPPLQIPAGETIHCPISLMATVARENRKPGAHTIQAFYEYGPLTAASEPVQIEYVEP